jgi:beta-lactamase regulating signal transducer with metallopeptidase domain
MSFFTSQLGAIRGGELTWLFGLLIDTALKGTLLIAAAAIASQILKNRSAAARHAAWTAAVVGHLALPILTLLVPAWRIPLFPAPPWVQAASVTAPAPSSLINTVTSTSASGSTENPDVEVKSAAPSSSAPSIVADEPGSILRSAPAVKINWPTISLLGLLWILGSGLVLLRLVVGTWKVGRLAKHGDRVDDGEWLSLTQRLANRLGISRPLTLLRGDSLAVPVTWGVVYPAVLLPPDSEEWPEARRRFVLVHEMAHVKRFDALTQLVAQLTVAILWFDPFLWYAVHRMRVEREHACDDYVLRDGTQPSLYAGELLEMVQSIGSAGHDRAAPAFAALAMARRSEFEGRMLAILDARQNRHTLGRASAVVAGVALALLVLPLAALRPFHQPVALASAAPRPSTPKTSQPLDAGRLYPDFACDTARTSEGTILQHTHSDGDEARGVVEFLRTDGRGCAQAAIVGSAVFSNDRLIVLNDGAYVMLREKKPGDDRLVRATRGDDGAIAYAARYNGSPVPYDDTMRAWFAKFLPAALTETGVRVPERVARDYAAGGVNQVLSRIASISSTASRRAHYDALLDGRPLSPREYEQIANHASTYLAGSASDLTEVLNRVAAGPAKGTKGLKNALGYIFKAQESGKTGLTQALSTSKSKSDSVAAITQYAMTDDPDMMLFALQGAKGIDSDTDKRTLLETVAAGALRRKSEALRKAYFDVVYTMTSDTDLRAVSIAALPYAHIDEQISFAVFKVVETKIESDTDKRAVLTTAIEQHLLNTAQLRSAFMAAVKTIESSTDYTAVMQAAFKNSPN